MSDHLIFHLIVFLVHMNLEMRMLDLSVEHHQLRFLTAVLVVAARDDTRRYCSIISHSLESFGLVSVGNIFKNLLLEIVFSKYVSDRITNWLMNGLVSNDLHELENCLRKYVWIVSADLGV